MDKYEYKLKLEQLKNLVEAEDYGTAAEIANSINWKKVRNSNTLSMVAKIYEKTGDYEACRDVLLQAYDHSSIGKNIIIQLVEVAIKAQKLAEAQEYYEEFLEIAPKDNQRYIMAYKISCLKDAPIIDRISILEQLKDREYTEMWAYELAALYSQVGMREQCVDACDEIVLWFGDGEYVEKALDLKRTFQPLTASQEEKYKKIRENRGVIDVEVAKKVEATISEESGLPEITVSASKFNTVNLQEELAKSMQQIMDATEKEAVTESMETIKKIVSDIPYLAPENTGEEGLGQDKINEEVDESLKADFRELMDEKTETPKKISIPQNTIRDQQVAGQLSIEEVLADWEKTKRAAEEAIAAAEQKKLEMTKEQALSEANEIMSRLQSLLPLLTATPGEDLPEVPETVGDSIKPEEPKEAVVIADTDGMTELQPELMVGEPETKVEDVEDAEGAAQKEPVAAADATKEMPDVSQNRTEGDAKAENPDDELEAFLTETTMALAAEAAVEVEEQSDDVKEDSVEESDEMALPEITDVTEEENASEATEEMEAEEEHKEESKAGEQGILTEEDRKMFSYFLPVPGVEEQIVQILEDAQKNAANTITSLRGNYIVQGEEGSGKTVLATSLIKKIQKMTGKEDSKIGKISSEALNRRDFAALIPKLAGGFLIVDKAGELSEQTVARMSQVMERNTQGLVVILEDDSAGIKRVLSMNPSFAKKFTGRVKIPVFTIDELVDFGKSYAAEMECVIETMGVLALYNRITNIQKIDRATTLAEVKAIVDKAIESAESGGFKKLFSKKYNENDYLILREKDFE